MQAGAPALALPNYRSALEADPSRRQFWLSYANALLASGNMAEARQVLLTGRARGLDGPEVDALLQQADVAERVRRLFVETVSHHTAGRLDEAERGYRAVLANAPLHVEAHCNLGAVLLLQGRLGEAEASLRTAVAMVPGFVDALNNLGVVLRSLGRHSESAAACRRALESDPESTSSHYNLAAALRDLDRLDEAEAHCRRTLELDSLHAGAHLLLAGILLGRGARDSADAHCRRALEIEPGNADALLALGNVLHASGRDEEAAENYRHALSIRPDFAAAHSNLGRVLRELGRSVEAAESCRRAIDCRPDHAGAHVNLGNALHDLGLLDEAIACYRRAIEIAPGDPDGYRNLGNVLRESGHIGEATGLLERASTLAPTQSEIRRSLLLTLVYDADVGPSESFAAHVRFGAETAETSERAPRFANAPDPSRPLRVGYMSSDFRAHSAARNLLPLFRAHDRRAVELFLYAEVARPDETTAEFRRAADVWRSTVRLDDREAAEVIRSDGIDILVCLAGRFDRNRPMVSTFRPAPVQISSHDVATSGLRSFDYLVSDRILTPRGTPERFVERVLCLPRFYLAEMPAELPRIMPRAGPPVFGCLNNPAKVSDAVLDLWAALLDRVPDSRLVLRYLNWYESGSLRSRVHAALDRRGVERSRVEFPPVAGSHREHLEVYNRVDVALDTFPFSGSTTTFDALAMGVPVVTLPGWSMVSRWSAAMLQGVGLGSLVATSGDSYLDIAARLAADTPRLAQLRAGLRERLAASPLCDARRRAGQVERLYRAVWRRWCSRNA